MFPELENQRAAILARLDDFASVPEEAHLRELLICLLTPQSSPVRAEGALVVLERQGFFQGMLDEGEVAGILRTPSSYVRFHNVKAKRLVALRNEWPELKKALQACPSQYEERRLLVSRVNGFGWKEASHALRNIGRRDLAILDRHILRELYDYKVISSVPGNLSERGYHEIEQQFRDFAKGAGEELDVLDLYFWSKRTGFIYK